MRKTGAQRRQNVRPGHKLIHDKTRLSNPDLKHNMLLDSQFQCGHNISYWIDTSWISQIRLQRFHCTEQKKATYSEQDSTYNTYPFNGRCVAVLVPMFKADNGESNPSHRNQGTDHIHGHDSLPLGKLLKIIKANSFRISQEARKENG